ncbi:MAG: hypothetical protein K2G87_08055, partial [Oscillospiraceae bacterium]|nr:hypothetical protein [Oscillospiraceae bacterium]
MRIEKRIGAALTASALAFGLLATPLENVPLSFGAAVSAQEKQEQEQIVSAYISAADTSSLPDSRELEEAYINSLFYGGGFSFYKDFGRAQLSGAALELYDLLKPEIEAIADGSKSITAFDISMTKSFNDVDDLRSGISDVTTALLADLPSSFYWYDKTIGNPYSYSLTGGNTKVTFMCFEVAEKYQLSGGKTQTMNYSDGTSATYHIQVNSAKITAAQNAAKKAQEIAAEYDGLSDYEKIMGYCKEICKLASYNDDAAAGSEAYGDPWQLVWVFDEDPSTEVVCEGYSKAFQYLCDIGGVNCYTVSGWAEKGNDGSRHMWNIVVMDDNKSYLVDVTWSDKGETADERWILKGATSSSGTEFTINGDTREYYPQTIAFYPETVLTISTTDYIPAAPKPVLNMPETVSADWDAVEDIICTSKNVPSADTLTVISSDEAVAEVSIKAFNAENGEITLSVDGKGAGKTTITITCTAEDGTKVSKECQVTLHKWKTEWSKDDTNHWYECEDETCTEKKSSEKHDMEKDADSAEEATCTKDGKEADMKCSKCGYTEEGETIEKTGHTPDEPTQENIENATCTTAGSYDEVTYCTKCGEELKRIPVTGAMLPHEMEEVEGTAKKPTCGEAGKEANKKCKNCVHTEEGAEIPATGNHTEGEPKRINEVAATCYSEGSYDEVIECTVCGKELSKEHKTIDKIDHTPGEPTMENETPATCTKDGSYDLVTKCTVAECGEVIKTEHVNVPALGHDFGSLVQGETTHYQECSRCDAKVGEAAHTKDSGTVTTAPTEENDGVRTYSCTVCGKVLDTETIPALEEGHEHSYTIKNSDASSHWNECVCGVKDPASIAAHTEAEKAEIALEAVCNVDGLKYVITYCTDCDREISRNSESIPKTGVHNPSADYDKDSTDHWNTCTYCGSVVNKEPHTAGPAATETTPQTCTVCGYEINPVSA